MSDCENCLEVKLANKGAGLLIVKTAAFEQGERRQGNLVNWIKLNDAVFYDEFRDLYPGRSISSNEALILLRIKEVSNPQNWTSIRDRIREQIHQLVLNLDYTDIYESNFDRYSKGLSWFGRNLG